MNPTYDKYNLKEKDEWFISNNNISGGQMSSKFGQNKNINNLNQGQTKYLDQQKNLSQKRTTPKNNFIKIDLNTLNNYNYNNNNKYQNLNLNEVQLPKISNINENNKYKMLVNNHHSSNSNRIPRDNNKNRDKKIKYKKVNLERNNENNSKINSTTEERKIRNNIISTNANLQTTNFSSKSRSFEMSKNFKYNSNNQNLINKNNNIMLNMKNNRPNLNKMEPSAITREEYNKNINMNKLNKIIKIDQYHCNSSNNNKNDDISNKIKINLNINKEKENNSYQPNKSKNFEIINNKNVYEIQNKKNEDINIKNIPNNNYILEESKEKKISQKTNEKKKEPEDNVTQSKNEFKIEKNSDVVDSNFDQNKHSEQISNNSDIEIKFEYDNTLKNNNINIDKEYLSKYLNLNTNNENDNDTVGKNNQKKNNNNEKTNDKQNKEKDFIKGKEINENKNIDIKINNNVTNNNNNNNNNVFEKNNSNNNNINKKNNNVNNVHNINRNNDNVNNTKKENKHNFDGLDDNIDFRISSIKGNNGNNMNFDYKIKEEFSFTSSRQEPEYSIKDSKKDEIKSNPFIKNTNKNENRSSNNNNDLYKKDSLTNNQNEDVSNYNMNFYESKILAGNNLNDINSNFSNSNILLKNSENNTSCNVSNNINEYNNYYNQYIKTTNSYNETSNEQNCSKNGKEFKNLIPNNAFKKFLTSKIKYYMKEDSIPKKFISQFFEDKNNNKAKKTNSFRNQLYKNIDLNMFNNKKIYEKNLLTDENQKELDSIGRKHYLKSQRINHLALDIEENNYEYENLNNKYNRKNEMIKEEYEMKKTLLLDQNKELINKINELQGVIDNSKNQMEERDKQIKKYLSTYDKISSENEENKKKIENLVDELKAKNNEVEEKKKKINELNNINNNLENKMIKLKEEYVNEAMNNKETKENYVSIKNDYNDMKNQYDLLNIKYQTLSDENFNFRRNNLLYEKELKTKNLMIEDLLQSNSNIKQRELNGRLNKLQLYQADESENEKYFNAPGGETKEEGTNTIEEKTGDNTNVKKEEKNVKDKKENEKKVDNRNFEDYGLDELKSTRDQLLIDRKNVTNEYYKLPTKGINSAQIKKRNDLELKLEQINRDLARLRIRINILKKSKDY